MQHQPVVFRGKVGGGHMNPGGAGIQCHIADKGVMPEIHPRAKTQPFRANRQPRRQLARCPQPQIVRACRPCQRITALRLAAEKATAFLQLAKPRLDTVAAAAEAAADTIVTKRICLTPPGRRGNAGAREKHPGMQVTGQLPVRFRADNVMRLRGQRLPDRRDHMTSAQQRGG